MDNQRLLTAPIGQVLWQMSVPNFIGIVTMMGFNLADTYFISQISTEALTAFSLTFPITLLLTSLTTGIGASVSTNLGRYIGAGDFSQAQAYFYDALLITLVLSSGCCLLLYGLQAPLFLFLGASFESLPLIAAYLNPWLLGCPMLALMLVANQGLRAAGDSRSPAKIMMFAAVLNLLFDPLLIFGLPAWFPIELTGLEWAWLTQGLGLQGAAFATLLAWLIACLLCGYLLIIRNRLLILLPWCRQRFARHWQMLLYIAKPAAVMNLINPLINAFLIALLTRLDYAAVAAFGAGLRLESFALMGVFALSSSLVPFVAQNLGAMQQQRAAAALIKSLHFVCLLQCLIYLPVFYYRVEISQLFIADLDAQQYLQSYMIYLPAVYFALAMTILVANVLNAYQQPNVSLLINGCRLLLGILPCCALGGYFWQVEGVFAGLALSNLLIGLGCYWLIRSKLEAPEPR